MKENSVNTQIALVVNGISSPQFLLWKPLIAKLICDEFEIVYFIGNGLSEEDNQVIEIIGKDSLIIKKFEKENLPASIDWVLFTSTADRLPHYTTEENSLKLVCFFGGITSENLGNQAEAAMNLNINTLFSDLMPSEVRESLSQKCFSFFVERNFFLPPAIPSHTAQDNSFAEDSLFIFNHHETETMPHSSELYVKIFKEIDSFRIVDLSESPVDEWINQCTPSKTCKRVMIDITYRPIIQFLVNICSCREIDLQTLGIRGALTPERALLEKSENSANWLHHIAPLNEPSLREKTQSILIANPLDDAKGNRNEGNSSNESESSIISSVFFDNENAQNHELLEKIRLHYSVARSNVKSHYITSPFSHFFQGSAHVDKLQSSLEFFLAQNDLPSSCPAFENLLATGLRLTAEQQVCRANFHILGKIKSFAPEHLLKSFSSLFLQNPKAQKSINLASYFQHNLQFLQWNEKVIASYYERLLAMPLPANILASLFLGANKLDLLGQLTQSSRKQGLQGLLGRATYYKVCATPAMQAEEAKALEDLCRREISEGSDNISTYVSLATLGILFQNPKDPSKILIESSKPSCDIKAHLLFRHELSLLCLTTGDNEGANLFWAEGDQPFAGKTTYTTLSAIVISILLDKIETAEALSENLLQRRITQPWDDKLHSIYHFALFHALLFRKTNKNTSEIHATKIMDESIIPRDSSFRNLLGKIEETKEVKDNSHLVALAEFLEPELPTVQELIPLNKV